jgi:hypothetical protein
VRLIWAATHRLLKPIFCQFVLGNLQGNKDHEFGSFVGIRRWDRNEYSRFTKPVVSVHQYARAGDSLLNLTHVFDEARLVTFFVNKLAMLECRCRIAEDSVIAESAGKMIAIFVVCVKTRDRGVLS